MQGTTGLELFTCRSACDYGDHAIDSEELAGVKCTHVDGWSVAVLDLGSLILLLGVAAVGRYKASFWRLSLGKLAYR